MALLEASAAAIVLPGSARSQTVRKELAMRVQVTVLGRMALDGPPMRRDSIFTAQQHANKRQVVT